MIGGGLFILLLLFQLPADAEGAGAMNSGLHRLSASPADSLRPEPQIPVPPDTSRVLPGQEDGQPPDTLRSEPADSLRNEPADTLRSEPADTTGTPPGPPASQEEILQIVDIWPVSNPPARPIAETDSTLRWFMALNLVDRFYHRPGVITYRTGRLGQLSGLDIHSYEKRHQSLMLNEMEVTSPVTGQVNWNRLPIHKIHTVRAGSRSWTHRSEVLLREHYTVQPMTFLNFDEGSGDYRNLEFSFAHNLTPRTHLELSFWDRRDGNLYPRNMLEGRQIVAKMRYNLSDRLMLKAGYINNGFDQQQSFGYSVPDPEFYHFNPYSATAMEPSANSSDTTNDLYLQLFRRLSDDQAPRQAAGLHYRTDNWELAWSQDTSATSLQDIGAFVWQEASAGEAVFRVRADARVLHDDSGRSLTRSSWTEGRLSLTGEMPLFPWLKTWLDSGYEVRDDSRSGYHASAGAVFTPLDRITLEAFGGLGSSVPDLQPLYWNSIEYQGDESLENENGFHGGALASVGLGRWFTIGVRTDAREVTDGIFVSPEGMFVNSDPYRNLSTAAWLQLDSPIFEGLLSATLQEFVTRSAHPVNIRLRDGGQRLWLKGSLYWKNYVFGRAAFVKAGLSGMMTPGNYTPADFLVPLNRWQHGGAARPLPAFHRLDLDLSARIRWFMLLVRYENILDGVQQLGYFEADSYPMPYRRFILGFRIVFTN